MNNPNNKITRHHKIPKEKGWTNHNHNIARLKALEHKWEHFFFWNALPHEQIIKVIDITGRAMNKVLANNIREAILSCEFEDMYSEKCIDMDKYIRHILATKNN